MEVDLSPNTLGRGVIKGSKTELKGLVVYVIYISYLEITQYQYPKYDSRVRSGHN